MCPELWKPVTVLSGLSWLNIVNWCEPLNHQMCPVSSVQVQMLEVLIITVVASLTGIDFKT